MLLNRCNGVVVRASALQSVDLGFIFLVRSSQNTLKNDICCFPTGRLVRKDWCRDEAVECACCVYGQGLPKISTTYRLVTICTLFTPATLFICIKIDASFFVRHARYLTHCKSTCSVVKYSKF